MILSAAKTYKIPCRYFKPIQTGEENDCETVKTLAQLQESQIIRPLFSFQLPAAPYRAALAENKKIDLDTIVHKVQQLSPIPTVIEGAGGLCVPLTENYLIRDLVEKLRILLLIVASTQLGTINHTLLTIEAALAKKIPIEGLILSGPPDPGLSDLFEKFTDIPVLAEIPGLEKISPQTIKKIAPTIFNQSFLEKILT
jgi:malonyl-CoA O-methyltransferase